MSGLTALATPLLSAVAATDPISGVPEIVLTVENVQAFNLCPEADSTFETGIGSATPVSNCIVAQTKAQALDGVASLAIIAISAGAMTVREGPYPVAPNTLYSFTAAFRAAVATETVSVSVEWYDGASLVSTTAGTTLVDSASAWGAINPPQTATSPSTATQAYLLHTIANAAGAVAVPGIPTVTPTGTTGSTTWHYGVTAYNGYGETPISPIGTTTTGNATLSGSNYNALSWSADSGATGYNIYRSPGVTCADIAGDFANCADLITAFATCSALLTYVPEPHYIGTTTSTSIHDTGLTGTTRTAPATNTTGETHYVDEVGLFIGTAAGWIEAQSGNLAIQRSDGQYVLGASPLFPTVIGSAPETVAIIDYTAPYGVDSTYSAILTANRLSSPPSVPSSPVLMGQAPDTLGLYDRIGWAKDEDASGELLIWLAGIGEMVQAVDSLCVAQAVDGQPVPPWSQVLDINRCPTAALPWLGQFVGVQVDPSQRDDEQRYAIEQEHGFARGTPAAILAAADKYLLPGYSASLLERDTSPYHLTIDIPSAGVDGNATCRSLYLSVPTCSLVYGRYTTCADLWDSTVPINNAVFAAIPAGLVAVLSYI